MSALTFTGQSAPIRAVHCCEYGVSPGNTGVPGASGGEMSQTVRMTLDTITPLDS